MSFLEPTTIARIVATCAILYVWGAVSIKNGKIESIPWPVMIALLAAWGIQVAPDMLASAGKVMGG